jgi:transcription-repair coupling factor (superfamily II helicase)
MSPTGAAVKALRQDGVATTETLTAEVLAPGPGPLAQRRPASGQAPTAAVAVALSGCARAAKAGALVHLASSERRAEEIGRALGGLAPDLGVLVLPPWDCLPYDRASPSRELMGRRLRVVRELAAKGAGPRIVITSPEALIQRLPPRSVVAEACLELRKGEVLDRKALAEFAQRTGYVADDRIDEPGEIALLGEVADIYPADAARPVRVVFRDDDRIAEIRIYDPLSQRSEGEIDALSLGPASELIVPADAADTIGERRTPGVEHRLAAHYGALETLFDMLPKGRLSQDPKALDALALAQAHVQEAYEARVSLASLDAEPVAGPTGLYLSEEEFAEGLRGWKALDLALEGIGSIPNLAAARNPGRAFCDLVSGHREAGRRVVLTGMKSEQRALARALARGLELQPTTVEAWSAVLAAPAGSVVAQELDLESGFIDEAARLVVIAAGDILGGRLAARTPQREVELLAEPDLRIGDVVLHEDHGIGVLRDLKSVQIDGQDRDTLELEYHGDACILAPIDEIGRIWRYGAEEGAVALDRLTGDGWSKRRAEVSRQVDETAQALVALAKARDAAVCAPIVPPKAAYAKFSARFAYPETPDQTSAIEAVLADLALGRPMDRLVCGDVGFGKTEVALRAAAAVALSGRQVAVAAPTTVLARQHFETFQRRFAGTGIEVAQLSRLVTPGQAQEVRERVAAGEIGVVVGTHALAGRTVSFADLGLMIIDEEQKFGTALKDQLRAMASKGHLLALTATPIPRTLQAAMIGIQDVSVIASPPARRRPIRTFLAPYDPATLRTALLREQRRGGQSFFVVPRIEDIGVIAERLAQLVPELSVRVAHGELAAEAADAVMVGFADGDGDILLATNIIESGLDVPRANTMFVWRPDRFGLSQLHQLRGRVGRGRVQGVAYLLADPAEDLSDATRARLSTLEAFDRLGSGLAISARDLDLRGGGDLVGDEQAGHVKMIGSALYQRLLERAVRVARGEALDADWLPVLNLGEAGSIPTSYVPDAVTRINLYARLARMEGAGEVEAFEEELEDRFGPVPVEAAALLALARLQGLARLAGVRHVGAGPRGIALSLAPGAAQAALSRVQGLERRAALKDDRLVIPAVEEGPARFAAIERFLGILAPQT